MHLAQINIAKALAPLDSPQLKEFVDNLDAVNATAENSEGFIWRYKDEEELVLFDDPLIIVNMSVWTSAESLKHFMFKTHHLGFMQRKHEWFEKLPQANMALWWCETSWQPNLQEGIERLLFLRENGESEHAFSFRSKQYLTLSA